MEPYNNLDLIKKNDNGNEYKKYLKSTIKTKSRNKNNYELNFDLINLLENLRKIRNKNYDKPIDSLLIFAITYKIFYDLGICEYASVYKRRNIIYICKEKMTNQIWIEEDKNNDTKINNYLYDEINIKYETENKIAIKTEEYYENISFMMKDVYSLLFNYKKNKTKNFKFESKRCDSFLFNEINQKEYINKIHINSDSKEFKNAFKLKTNHEDLENLNELITDINNNLFNLLCDLINENNSNYLIKSANYFLMFTIIYKILYDIGIPGYIYIYPFQGKIQICKEIINNKIGILEDENNKIKLKNFIRKQDINFKESKKAEIEMSNHLMNIESDVKTIFNLLELYKPENQKFVKMFCDTIIFDHFQSEEKSFQISDKIKRKIEKKKIINSNYKLNENCDNDEIQTKKNKKRESFLRKIEMFENKVYETKKNNIEKIDKNLKYKFRSFTKEKVKILDKNCISKLEKDE